MTAGRAGATMPSGAWWLLALGVGLGACAEDAPRDRGEPRHPDSGMRRPRPDAGRTYDGTCGGETCPEVARFTEPCCTAPGTGEVGDALENVGRAADRCGADLGLIVPSLQGYCLQIEQPGSPDRQCPAQVSIEGGASRAGCCTDEGYCGSLDPIVPLGCFYATGLKGRRCDPTADEDAGTP